MDTQDARTLLPATQEQLRKQAIRLKQQGMSFVDIAAIVAVHRNTVAKWWKIYVHEGLKGLKAQPRGRRVGAQRTLLVEQERTIQRLICDKNPDQYKLPFALWTRQAVQELMAVRLKVRMPIRTVGEYLKRWGFTPQKPLKRAYEQRPAAVRHWLDEDYPAIACRAKQEQAEIHWGDETGMRNDSQHGRSYAPRGHTPVIRLSAKRASTNMISTVTNQGKVRFMIYSGSMNASRLIQFFNQLLKGANKKIFLILDNLRVHHAKPVKAWLAEPRNTTRIEVFFLPAYSPELNPDEYLNGDLKVGVHAKPPTRDTATLKKNVRAHMRMLQQSPTRVSHDFNHPKIRYAA